MKQKKLWALLLASVMAVSTVSGCASSGGSGETAPKTETGSSTAETKTSAAGGETAGGETKEASADVSDGKGTGEKVTLTVGVVSNPLIIDYETNTFTKKIEDELNVDLEFVMFPADKKEALTKLNLMISSNSELPDVLCMNILDDITVYTFGSKGVLVPLEEYVNDADVMKNFHSIDADAVDSIIKNSESPDGHIYALTANNPATFWNEGPYRLWVNENWLEKLNLSMPETTEDFYNVLKAFVNEDPNGNGINDEIGMVGAKSGWALDVIPFIMNAFVYANPDKDYLNVVDGKIVPAYTQDGWKEGLEFLKKLVDEGLLSPLSFTQDQNQLKALIQVEGGMAGFVPAGSYSIFGAGAGLEFDEMQLVPPLTGPEGVSYNPYNPILPVKTWFITKDCKNVDKAIEVGDWFYTREASMHSRYGEYGVDWDDDPAEAALWATRYDDVKCEFYNLNFELWGHQQNTHWANNNPRYLDRNCPKIEGLVKFEDMPAEGEPLTREPDFNQKYDATYPQKRPTEYITFLPYTFDEAESIAVSSTDITNHVKDMSVAFITGNRSLDEWDAFLAELEAMGLENYIKVVQSAYDRSK